MKSLNSTLKEAGFSEKFIDAINNVNLQTEIPDERLQLNEAWEDIYNFLTQ